ncbi:MAG: alpha-hydroxy acid oxidase [Actinomycetota bacterium]
MAELMDRYPAIADLERRAMRRLPSFAREYLVSGTGDEATVRRNRSAFEAVTFRPQFLKGELEPDTGTTLFGRRYAAPIGAAPVGLTGLIWPGTDETLARLAAERRIPHTLSTVATTKPETVGPLTRGHGWFQLYPPREASIRDDLIERAAASGFDVMVVTADVPAPSRRERQRRARVRVPPVIGPTLVAQAAIHPSWTVATLRKGIPKFETLEPYIDSSTLRQMSGFIGARLGGTLSWDYLAEIRKRWDGPLVVKGILDVDDAERCLAEGADAVQVSNHGGRQLEAAPSPLEALDAILERVDGRAPVLLDSGVRSGADVARALALGADFVFAGRAFLFGIAALGERGADHAFEILHDGLVNVMHQTGCSTIDELRTRGVGVDG